MLRAVGDGQGGFFRQRLHATLSLRELFEEPQPVAELLDGLVYIAELVL